jgi:serine/threonine-protein kinase
MSHPDDPISNRPAADLADGDEEIELEPTIHQPGAAVALRGGSLASLSGETDTLRRKRLLAAAVFLAATFGLLCTWVYASDNPATLTVDGSRYSLRVGLIVLRCLLATIVAGVLASEVELTRKQLRVLENILFLGLTLLLAASQYFVGLDLMRRGPEYTPLILAFIKDAVIQMMALMMLYGTLIPNPPTIAARTLVAMFVIPVASGLLLRFHPDVAPVVAQLAAAEESGSNILLLGVGAALALYGSYLLNGLRTELHAAKKLGQYQLGEKLGEGGMGEVYMAEHQLLKRPCALKLIRPDVNTNPIALARFEREVQSAAMLSHPNTIEIFDYGHADDGTFYYVMEYLPGLSVSDLVKQFGPMAPGRVVYLMRQVCGALAEAHRFGLVHRDLKPANILVAIQGGKCDIAKVLDFGLVKLTATPDAPQLTADYTVSGTPQYMSPEQATANRDVDGRADLYSLGAILYYMLIGRPPFEGTNPTELMIAHARDPVVPPSHHRGDIPPDLEAVVVRCLAKKPQERYPDARALSMALAACACAGDWDDEKADEWWVDQANSRVRATQVELVAAPGAGAST